jgi:hypothetical protein
MIVTPAMSENSTKPILQPKSGMRSRLAKYEPAMKGTMITAATIRTGTKFDIERVLDYCVGVWGRFYVRPGCVGPRYVGQGEGG